MLTRAYCRLAQAPVANKITAVSALRPYARYFSSQRTEAPLDEETRQMIRSLAEAPAVAKQLFMRDMLESAQRCGKVVVRTDAANRTITVEAMGNPGELSTSAADILAPLHSAMGVAESIEVTHAANGSQVKVTSDGNTFSLSEGASLGSDGVSIVCRLREGMGMPLDEEAARRVVSEAARNMRNPVFFLEGAQETLVNQQAPLASSFAFSAPAAPVAPMGGSFMQGLRASAPSPAAPGLNAFNFWHFISFSWNYWLEYRNIFIFAFRYLFQTFRPLIAVYISSSLMKTVFSLTLSTTFLIFFSLMAGFEVFYFGLQLYISSLFLTFFSKL